MERQVPVRDIKDYSRDPSFVRDDSVPRGPMKWRMHCQWLEPGSGDAPGLRKVHYIEASLACKQRMLAAHRCDGAGRRKRERANEAGYGLTEYYTAKKSRTVAGTSKPRST